MVGITVRAKMIQLKLDWLHWTLLVAVGFLLALFWLTPYTYHQNAGLVVRIHRVTGKAEMLHPSGRERMEERSEKQSGFSATTEQRRGLPSGFVDDLGILEKNPTEQSR